MSGMGGLALMRVELNSILLVILLALLQEKQLVSNGCYKNYLKNKSYHNSRKWNLNIHAQDTPLVNAF